MKTMTEIICEKIQLLYDFCILMTRYHMHDPNENRVREMLEACKSEREIERTLHDVLVGNETLAQLLARKGF